MVKPFVDIQLVDLRKNTFCAFYGNMAVSSKSSKRIPPAKRAAVGIASSQGYHIAEVKMLLVNIYTFRVFRTLATASSANLIEFYIVF